MMLPLNGLATAALILVLASGASAGLVKSVNDAELTKLVAENPLVLMKFYAPWCGHCKAMAPEYEAAAVALQDWKPAVVLAECDATVATDAAKVHNVQGFPTLKWFVNGDAKEYGGGRTEPEIVAWVQKKTGSAAKALASQAEVEEFKKTADVVVVGVFDNEAEREAFEKAAKEHTQIPFGHLTGTATEAPTLTGVSTPGLAMFTVFDSGSVGYDGDIADAEAIEAFVAANELPLIVPFSQETAPKIFGGAIDVHVLLFINALEEKATAGVLSAARPVAASNRGKVVFVTVDVTDDRILEFFDVDAATAIPAVRIVHMDGEGMLKFTFNEDTITTGGLSAFVRSFFAGGLTPQLRSQEPPAETQGDGEVHTLVGTSFEATIGGEANVFVEFYAPWCGHCKKLKPVWEELATKFKGVENVVIADIDSTANELEHVQVSGFPTLKLFLANSQKIVDYDGPRELDDLVAFVKQECNL